MNYPQAPPVASILLSLPLILGEEYGWRGYLLDNLARPGAGLLLLCHITSCVTGPMNAKKGQASAGVARMWNGRLGKVESSQVGVFSALCRNKRVTLLDSRLYLPKRWIDDPERCQRAAIPV